MCPISGSNWNNGTNTGVWYVNLNNTRNNSNNNVSFRSDSAKPRNLKQQYGGSKGDDFQRVVNSTAKLECLYFSSKLLVSESQV